MSKIKNNSTDRLFEAMMKFETIDEFYQFFEDLCTIKEIKEMSQRLDIAFLLKEKLSYLEISNRTGASTTTISRINRCLNYGSDGYELAMSKLDEN
ncbi:MAG: YerC/YecD family TrpR-related protein [Clostridia bacterium]